MKSSSSTDNNTCEDFLDYAPIEMICETQPEIRNTRIKELQLMKVDNFVSGKIKKTLKELREAKKNAIIDKKNAISQMKDAKRNLKDSQRTNIDLKERNERLVRLLAESDAKQDYYAGNLRINKQDIEIIIKELSKYKKRDNVSIGYMIKLLEMIRNYT